MSAKPVASSFVMSGEGAMISVGVEYSPETGTVSCIIKTDAKYNPDAVDDMAKRVAETFAKAIGTVVERAAQPD